MFRPRSVLTALALSAVAATPALAQNGDTSSCDLVSDLVSSGDYADALYELDICRNNVRKLWFDGMLEVVNVPMAGLQPSDGTIEGAMGINVITIHHGPWESTFTSGSGAAEDPMSSLASLAGGLSGAFGVRQEGVEDVRLGRRTTGKLETRGDDLTMTVALDEGMLVTKGDGGRDQLTELVQGLIEALEDYIR